MPAVDVLAEPAFTSIPAYERTLGPEVADLCDMVGFGPDPEQRLILDATFAFRSDGKPAAFEVADIVSRQNMKALDVDTPLLTTRGWKSMGTVRVGDEVYAPDGTPVAVTHVSTVKYGHDCYRVTTTDGRSLIADAGHLWTVRDNRTRRWVTVTTADMLAGDLDRGADRTVVTDGVRNTTREYRWTLPRQQALQTPAADLPIDPYLFGAWLGDGTSSSGCLSSHADDVPHWVETIQRCGWIPTVRVDRTCSTVGITTTPGVGRNGRSFAGALRRLGVLNDKHVPDVYLTASADQRQALLQGLLDTDGTIHRVSGQCTFTSVTEQLAESVLLLVRSLGWRAGFRKTTTHLGGPCFTVTFTPKTDDPHRPFLMERKAALVKPGPGRAGRHTVSIRSIEMVPSRPVICIKVAREDGLFLAGRDLMATHNTGLFKQMALGWLFLTQERLVIWSAHEFNTAQESFRDLSELVEGSDYLMKRVKAISRGNGDEGIELHGDRRIMFKARTKTGGRGLTGDKVVLDEAFALTPKHLGSLMPTLSTRRMAQIIYGSSAGLEDSAVLRAIRDRGRASSDPRLAYFEWCDDLPGECAAGDTCSHIYGQARGCRMDDQRRWFRANPQLGRRISLEFVESERRAMPPAEFGRERLGWWDEDPNLGGVFPEGRWESCADGESQIIGTPTWSVDVSLDRKRASVSNCGARMDGVPHLEMVENQPGTDWIVDFLAEKTRKWGGSVIIDPASPANSLSDDLEKAGATVHKLTARDYAASCGWLYDAVKEKGIRHLGQPELDASVRDAKMRDLAGGFAWDRRKPLSDITPLVSATLACWGHRTFGGDLAGAVW